MIRMVKHLFVNDAGQLVAEFEGGGSFVITQANSGKSGGYAPINGTGVVPGQYMPPTVATRSALDDLNIRLTRAALRLLATQKSDGGWQWNNPTTNPSQGLPSPYNTLGVTAQGLLDCYRQVPLTRLLDAATSTYKQIVINSKDPAPAKHRVRGPDITFLVSLSELYTDNTYALFAKDRWAAAMAEFGGGTPAGFAAYIRDARKGQSLPAIISWDINLYIQGTLALASYFPSGGYADQAKTMAEVIYNSLYVPPVDFDITLETQAEFWCGITGALEAFLTTGTHPQQISALRTKLIAGQQSDGHFVGVNGGSDAQTTAYALMALIKAGDDRPSVSAANYLVSSQKENGGWLYDGGENTEVTSEALQAIYDFICIC